MANAGKEEIKFEEVMGYELSTFPPALFENTSLPRKALKLPLMDSIDNAVNLNGPATDTYVLDGGSLLYRIGWKKKETFGNIAKIYASFVTKNYGNATNFLGKQEELVRNASNKERLIALISSELKNEGCIPIVCDGDAYLIIAQTAISLSVKTTVTVIVEDTDLLVLLLYHSQKSNYNLYLRSDKATAKNKIPRTFDICVCQEILGKRICNIILFRFLPSLLYFFGYRLTSFSGGLFCRKKRFLHRNIRTCRNFLCYGSRGNFSSSLFKFQYYIDMLVETVF